LKCDKVTDLGEMIETANKYADADDDAEGLLNVLAVPQSAKQPKQQAQKRKNTSEEKPDMDMPYGYPMLAYLVQPDGRPTRRPARVQDAQDVSAARSTYGHGLQSAQDKDTSRLEFEYNL